MPSMECIVKLLYIDIDDKTFEQSLHFFVFLERDAPYNPLCTHYSSSNNNSNSNNNVVSRSTNYTFYRVTYKI